jgi:hypothetical protein
MRSPPLALILLVGCGSVRLGEEEPQDQQDVDASSTLDAEVSDLQAVITVSVPDAGCASCMELSATGTGGAAPYRFEWEDGSALARRRVCADSNSSDRLILTVYDAAGHSSSRELRLELPARSCVDASVPKLCVSNGSFEGTPAVNTAGVFDALPWSDCTQPSRPNFPHVLNDTVQQWVTEIPDPTEGNTFLGLQESNQTSQPLCAPVMPGERRYFEFDARELDISNATGNNAEQTFLAVYGARSADCTTTDLLWVSPPLGLDWRRYCVELRPQSYMDRLVLQAITDQSSLAVSFLLVDNLVPVASCQ